MLEMKLATCEAVMGVLPESTDSLKTSYLSRESTYRLVIVDFGLRVVRYALTTRGKFIHLPGLYASPMPRHFELGKSEKHIHSSGIHKTARV